MKEVRVFHHYFINKCISSLIRGFADYFSTEFFDRTKEIVISTYSKAVQYYKQKQEGDLVKTNVKYPFLSLDPSMDFEPDPQSGRFLWEYPSYVTDYGIRMFYPKIYEDPYVLISVILNRYKGRFDLTAWCSSIYELMDFRTLTFQLFGGQERYIIPKNIGGYLILPNEVVSYTYENPYKAISYTLDWNNYSNCEVSLIKNINQQRMVFPFSLRPYIKLVGLASNNDSYGGPENDLSEYKLTLSCEWECSLPTHLLLYATKEPDITQRYNPLFTDDAARIFLDLDLCYDYYKLGGKDFSYNVSTRKIFYDLGTSKEDNSKWKETEEEMIFYKAFNYVITEEDDTNIHSDSPINFVVQLDQTVEDPFTLVIISKYGEMKRDHHWKVDVEDKSKIIFISFNLDSLKKDDVLWFVFYKAAE